VPAFRVCLPQLGDFGLATYRETEGDRPEDMNLVVGRARGLCVVLGGCSRAVPAAGDDVECFLGRNVVILAHIL
jgi:hypothetical protein